MRQRGMAALGLGLLYGMICPALQGQQTPAPVPVPTPLLGHRTAFVGVGPALLPFRSTEAAAILYSSMLHALDTGPYKVVQDPSAADLLLETSYVVRSGDVAFGSSTTEAFVQVVAIDAHSHAVLWTLDEDLQGAFKKSSFEKHVQDTAGKLVAYLKSLSEGRVP